MGSARRFWNAQPIPGAMTHEELLEKSAKANADFEALSEEDQILYLHRLVIGFSLNGRKIDEDIVRQHFTKKLGPKFAARILANPESRKKMGLED